MLVKYVTKMTAHQHGKTVTFMPKPLYGEAGSGMHFHQHLFKGGENIFYDADGYGCMSETALYYIGGLLKHGAALLAITNPSTNSYRRLVPGYRGAGERLLLAGQPQRGGAHPQVCQPAANGPHGVPPAGCHLQRLPGAGGAAAGGAGWHPQQDRPNGGRLRPDRRQHLRLVGGTAGWDQKLPSSMREAMLALEEDHAFLLAGEVFSLELIEQWVHYKMEMEYYQVRNRPHPYEVSLYFDV